MRNIILILSIVSGVVYFSSCSFLSNKGKEGGDGGKASEPVSLVVEAEDMILNDYEVEVGDSLTFVKLTDSTGTAQFSFPFPSGRYDIDVSYLSERVGQNTYGLYVGDNQIVAWLGKDKDDQWHKLSEQEWHIPRHIYIDKGEEIRINGLSENGSFVIFDKIVFTESIRQEVSDASHLIEENAYDEPTPLVTPKEDMVTIFPGEYNHAIKNPLKGFRAREEKHEYSTLIKYYFKWNELENSVNDGVNKIKSTCDERWKGIEKNNIKAIPRVYLEWPNRESGWPEDMTTGDYTSDQFKIRVVDLIKKLSEAWDNDPRVAYVEMGLIGEWGEQEFPNTTDEIKDAIAKQFHESFKNKLVMIRWPNTYSDHIYNFGYYWDSFGHHDQEYYAFHVNNTSPKWKTAVIGGEVAYNWGNDDIQPGESPDISLKTPKHRDYIIDRIRKLHANHLGWISYYDQDNAEVSAGADLMQKAMGYRFVITEFSYPERIENGKEFSISFKVKNTGSSPFYYNWPVEISLLNPESREVVWRKHCTDLNVTNWLPGEQWDNSANVYKIPAKTYTVNQTIKLSGVSPGEYILAVALLDPAGDLPCARFAINNYFKGGRHPIGKTGVNQTIDSFEISAFDDIQSDNSLFYELEN